jgi:hypothetical protein
MTIEKARVSRDNLSIQALGKMDGDLSLTHRRRPENYHHRRLAGRIM